MRPKPSIGLGITDNNIGNVLAMADGDQEEDVADKRKNKNPKAMEALRNAAPLMDFICMVATKGSSVQVAAILNEMNYSASPKGVIARAKRIRKGSSRRKPINLPLMSDETIGRGLTVNEDEINKAIANGDFTQLKEWSERK
jgi:hypothetical protein